MPLQLSAPPQPHCSFPSGGGRGTAALRDPIGMWGCAVKPPPFPWGSLRRRFPAPSLQPLGSLFGNWGGQDGYGAFRTPTSTLRYHIPWGCTETPDPNLGDALGLQTYTLGVHLDPKPKHLDVLQTPDPKAWGALGTPTHTLGVNSDPKPTPWGALGPQTQILGWT